MRIFTYIASTLSALVNFMNFHEICYLRACRNLSRKLKFH